MDHRKSWWYEIADVGWERTVRSLINIHSLFINTIEERKWCEGSSITHEGMKTSMPHSTTGRRIQIAEYSMLQVALSVFHSHISMSRHTCYSNNEAIVRSWFELSIVWAEMSNKAWLQFCRISIQKGCFCFLLIFQPTIESHHHDRPDLPTLSHRHFHRIYPLFDPPPLAFARMELGDMLLHDVVFACMFKPVH